MSSSFESSHSRPADRDIRAEHDDIGVCDTLKGLIAIRVNDLLLIGQNVILRPSLVIGISRLTLSVVRSGIASRTVVLHRGLVLRRVAGSSQRSRRGPPLESMILRGDNTGCDSSSYASGISRMRRRLLRSVTLRITAVSGFLEVRWQERSPGREHGQGG